MRVAVEVVDPAGVEGARPADDAVDLVALAEQQLGEVRPVLPGDPGDQRLLASGDPGDSVTRSYRRTGPARLGASRARRRPLPPQKTVVIVVVVVLPPRDRSGSRLSTTPRVRAPVFASASPSACDGAAAGPPGVDHEERPVRDRGQDRRIGHRLKRRAVDDDEVRGAGQDAPGWSASAVSPGARTGWAGVARW